MTALPLAASLGTDFVDAFRFMPDHLGLLWHNTVSTLALCGASLGIALAAALPLAVWLGHLHRGSLIAINLSNVGRALPELGLIAIFLAALGVGFVNVMLAIAIVAIPPILANGYTAVSGVEPDVVDAAKGVGMRPLQVLLRVELPLALPLVFAGIRTGALFVIGASPLAAFAGTGGLGELIVNQSDYGIGGVLAAALWVAALALVVQGLFGLLQRLITPRGIGARAGLGSTVSRSGGGEPADPRPRARAT